jgi:rubredoxin
VKKYRCMVCDHIYDPAEGDPAAGIAPGTDTVEAVIKECMAKPMERLARATLKR